MFSFHSTLIHFIGSFTSSIFHGEFYFVAFSLFFFKYYAILFLKRICKHSQRIFPIFFIGSSFRFIRNTNYRRLYRSLKENNARYNATIGEYLINTRSVIRLINLCEIEIDCCVNNRRYLNRKDKKLSLSHLQRGIIRFLKQAASLLSVEFLYARLYFANNYAFLPREKYIIVGWLAASRISNDRNKKDKSGSFGTKRVSIIFRVLRKYSVPR